MAQQTQQITDRTSFNPLNYSQISTQPQVHERNSRYSGAFGQQQPGQSFGSDEFTRADNKPTDNITEVAQGLKELQEKINNALKRSSSSNAVRTNPNVSAVPRVPSFRPLQTNAEPERTQKLYESYYETRSLASSNPSQPATAKYPPSDMKSSTISRGVSESTSQPYSSRFYLGGLNSTLTEKDKLLSSIQNYQVKTIHTLNSCRSLQSTQSYLQQTPLKKTTQDLGSSTILLNTSFVPIDGFQPNFDTKKLDHVISKIMSSNQSFNGLRQESFISNQDSYLTTKVNESTITQDAFRRTSQQSRPVKPTQPISHINPRKPATSQQAKRAKNAKTSCCGEVEPDGDSMILEFIKENDQLFIEDDEDERPAKRARAVEEDKPQPKKLSKRQEILNSKRQLKKETNIAQQKVGKSKK